MRNNRFYEMDCCMGEKYFFDSFEHSGGFGNRQLCIIALYQNTQLDRLGEIISQSITQILSFILIFSTVL